MEEKFDLLDEVLSLCESNGVQIENTQPDMFLGLPWVFTFKKTNNITNTREI